MRQPSLFISHGSPMLAIEDQPARRFLVELGQRIARPEAVLVVSAHYDMPRPTLTGAARPATVHDFGGFPRALYELEYPAPGAPELAQAAGRLLAERGLAAEVSADRGLDHGAWIPLMLMFPEADVPALQLSVTTRCDPRFHFELGRALGNLRREGVLVMGSGGATHNLREYFARVATATGTAGSTASEAAWLAPFEDWLTRQIETGDVEALLDYRARAPLAERAHPTEEHILPLFVALGAGDSPAGRRIHASRDHVLSMDAFEFD